MATETKNKKYPSWQNSVIVSFRVPKSAEKVVRENLQKKLEQIKKSKPELFNAQAVA